MFTYPSIKKDHKNREEKFLSVLTLKEETKEVNNKKSKLPCNHEIGTNKTDRSRNNNITNFRC